MKRDAQNLLPVSQVAVSIFEQSFPKILALVNEKFALETRFLDRDISCEQICMVRDTHKRFGELLLAIYQFHLYDHLIDEFSWYMSVLSSRGFEKSHLENMIKTWNIAIHSVIKPPESHELVGPLEWLYQNLSSLYEHLNAAEVKITEELQRFLGFLLKKDRKDATEYMLSLLKQGLSLESLYSDMLTSALKEIGRLWQKNEISVVDVHVATDICRYIMMRLADSIAPDDVLLPYKALVTCVPGEEHEMGAEILENYLETIGWQICSMGHIAPEADIIKAIVNSKPDVVFLSITLVSNLTSIKALAIKVREQKPNLKIVIGGHAAVLARDVLMNFADAIVNNIEEAHTRSLTLVSSHA